MALGKWHHGYNLHSHKFVKNKKGSFISVKFTGSLVSTGIILSVSAYF